MPQPYTSKSADKRPFFNHKALVERPQLATQIAVIAAIWTRIENGWGVVLAEMLDTEARVGVTMYLALSGSAAQRAVLQAVAEDRLPDELKANFAELLKIQKGPATERNTIVHGQWGGVKGDLKGLILGEGDWGAKATAAINHHEARPSILGPLIPTPTFQRYVERDFVATQTRLLELLGKLDGFRHSIRIERERRQSLEQARWSQSATGPGLLGTGQTTPEEPAQ
jgi:hypothetical protein